MWVDPQNQLISKNLEVRSSDRRYSVSQPYQRLWILSIDNVKRTDAGEYKCNIQTNPPQIKTVSLDVHGKMENLYAIINIIYLFIYLLSFI